MSCERQIRETGSVAVATRPVIEQPRVRIVKCDMADVAGRGRRDVKEIVPTQESSTVTSQKRIHLIRDF